MDRRTLHVSQFMSELPLSIGPRQPLAEAHRLMNEHKIRHLPVLRNGALAGLLSMDDLHLIETLRDVDPASALVEDAMTREALVVPPDEHLDVVAEAMVVRRLGSAVVVEKGRVVGMFTTVDALQALVEVTRARSRAELARARSRS